MASPSRFNFLKQLFLNENKEEMKKKDKIEDKKKSTCLDIPNTFRSEFHFLKFPFFDLSPRASKKDKIEIKERETTEEGEIEVLWKVVRGLERDFPSILARRIHKEVIEKGLNNTKKPIPRLIKLGSFRNICREMNITESGRNFEKIKKALKDIKSAEIEAKGTFRQREKNGVKKFFEGSFNLYDMVFFTGETLPNGKEANAVYVLLNDMYVQNFNYNFVVPLDYHYFKSLKGDIASRMYEILSIWFYPALENGKKYIQKEYSEICNYFPLTRQDTKKKAKGQLKKAHQQHMESGVLAIDPEWIDIGEENDWLIRYWIGPKAKEWHKQNKRLGNEKEDIKQIEKPKRVRAGESKGTKEVVEKEEEELVYQLTELGVTQKVAEDLVKKSTHEFVKGWTKAVFNTKAKDKAAFIVKAIEEKWELPEVFKKKKEDEEKRKELIKEQKRLSKFCQQYEKYKQDKINLCLSEISLKEKRQELKEIKERFFKTCPISKTWKKEILQGTIEARFKQNIEEKANVLSYENWLKEQKITI